uniref:Uncharacterized protein n=1 Tax=Picea glauca TaxID=3330 RepID=A0A101M458_PICGL|nr:hypothetical protein ABT39_MTgene391 [Picea glauca]
MFTSCCTIVKAMLSSTYELLSNRLPESILSMFLFLFLASFLRLFIFSLRCIFQQFSLVWTSMLQWLEWLF